MVARQAFVMTESFRRDGEYEQYDTPYQGAQQQHASSPVNPEWPPPPAQPPATPAAPVQQPVVEPTTVWPGGRRGPARRLRLRRRRFLRR